MIDIRALGYVVIEARDLARWEHFATRVAGMSLAPGPREDGVLRLKMDEYPYRLRVVQSAQDRFATAGWEVAGGAAFAQAARELEAAGVACSRASVTAAAARGVRELLSFTAPGGLACEIFHGMALDYLPLASPVGVPGFVTGYHGSMGLGHIAAATPDLDAAHRFFTAVMGFGQTDFMELHVGPDASAAGQGLHFLHCNNPRHHSLALFQDSQPHPGNLVHLMVEVPDLDSVGAFMDRVHAEGVRVITNLGRHTNDRMVSLYVETPAGFALEYGFAGVQIDWSGYLPTESARTSHWGHRWGQG
jgi:3,4-dihydroxy-9,10-secoandrosta-1,3,5(10)-triene-9,17-dione 4,5-dioxygenase